MAARLLAGYARRLARRSFAGVWLGGTRPGPDAPILFLANHTNWWDGFLGVLVNAHLQLHFHVLMEAQNLDRYWFFRPAGALPMHRTSASAAYADLSAARRHLGRPGTGLWIFPQGQRRPATAPIRGTETGAAHLALTAPRPVLVQPVAFRYSYLGEQFPEAFIWLGEPWLEPGGAVERPPREARRALARVCENRLEATVAALDARLAEEQLTEFTPLVPGRFSINKQLDLIRHRLGVLGGTFDRRNG